jgi:hypothetical protein
VNKAKQIDAKDRATSRHLLPLVALGGGLAASPAMALELGELSVESSLGQPLRASIAYALAPNEVLADTCVSVGGGRSMGGLPGIGPSTISITQTAIVITGRSVIREPVVGTRVTISCPYTPNLSREYMLFVDPSETAPVARPEETPVLRAASAPVTLTPRVDTPIGQSTRYQVQPGESLSEIAGRIENRTQSLWPTVNAVFAANPDAFIDNDPNKLKAGAWLTIPSLDGTAPVVSAAPARDSEAMAETVVAPADTTAPMDTGTGYEPEALDEPAETAEVVVETYAQVTEEPVVTDSTADLKPGDFVPEGALPESAQAAVIPDTELEGPQTTSTSPNVPTAIVSTGARNESTSVLMWLIGGGLAIIGALVVFGRRFRHRSEPQPAAPAAVPSSQATEAETADAEVFEDYDIDDDSPTSENLALDADLVIGTGLEEGVDVDVAHDFGFAQTTELDLELPSEPEAPADDNTTNIIPPMHADVESILESEVLPEEDEDEDDYDMSVIVDATQMPRPEDATERDLQAVQVEDFTVNQEATYDILEQDYEDELTATQALNQEIERAAANLAEDLDETPEDDENTSMLELATVSEIDQTAALPAADAAEEMTAEFEASFDPDDTNAVTVNIPGDDKRAELPVANDDETAEMDISGGKVDTKS